MEPLARIFDMSQYFKRFCFQWQTFDLLKKMRYILWVMALLLTCDVINNEQLSGYNHDKWVFFGA